MNKWPVYTYKSTETKISNDLGSELQLFHKVYVR